MPNSFAVTLAVSNAATNINVFVSSVSNINADLFTCKNTYSVLGLVQCIITCLCYLLLVQQKNEIPSRESHTSEHTPSATTRKALTGTKTVNAFIIPGCFQLACSIHVKFVSCWQQFNWVTGRMRFVCLYSCLLQPEINCHKVNHMICSCTEI